VKTLVVHNHYQQPGGEDVVACLEKQLLTAAGHQVVEYVRHNDEIRQYGLAELLALPLRTVWARDSYRDMKALLEREQPDVAHFHNTFPLVSPAAYYACREAAVPVVQTLHNYRLVCPAAIFFRGERVCEECLDHSLWRGVLHGCYRDSRAATTVVTLMLAAHRWRNAWTKGVNRFIALSEFSRSKFIQGGIPADKIAVKPNFVHPDPGCGDRSGDYALFIGRLSPEKRVITLLAAWERLGVRIPLLIAGSGPQRGFLETHAGQAGLPDVRFLGQLPREEVLAALKRAKCLVFTSEWYENFPMTIAEAFACGVPVICSRLGAMAEIVADGRTGLHFTTSDPEDLAQKVEWAWTHKERMAEMGKEARREYEAKYTAERNYPMLMEIYQRAIASNIQPDDP
jgi:glycosyltransferase involved in cell wall biosynthesis